ncbi:MAG: phosphatidylserine decarboxylase [Anaerolineae bacterium]|nr:phosphatidylserine decarboxylase [Anaerolineae bacterium]
MWSGILAAWREVPAIVLSLTGAVGLTLLARRRWLVLFPAILLGWVFYFFRDPERIPASTSPNVIIAPADGRVTDIELVHEPHFIQGQARRVSVFMTIFDVHVQHNPYPGQVLLTHYEPGSFAPAFLKDTRRNESNLIGLETPRGRLAIKQIAGILARRIVCWVENGDRVVAGQRLGLIRFGSRVDLLLPPEVEVLVKVGQQVYGGQTMMAKWN